MCKRTSSTWNRPPINRITIFDKLNPRFQIETNKCVSIIFIWVIFRYKASHVHSWAVFQRTQFSVNWKNSLWFSGKKEGKRMSERGRFNTELMLLFVSVRVQSVAENLMNYFSSWTSKMYLDFFSRWRRRINRMRNRHCRQKIWRWNENICNIKHDPNFAVSKRRWNAFSSKKKAD